MDQRSSPIVSAARPRVPRARAASGATAPRRPRGADVDPPKLLPRRQQSPWVGRLLVFATCVLMLDALFGERGLAETRRARQVFEQAEREVGRMKQENAGLREQARRLRDDPGTIESVAREELGLIKRGEILIVIKDLAASHAP